MLMDASMFRCLKNWLRVEVQHLFAEKGIYHGVS